MMNLPSDGQGVVLPELDPLSARRLASLQIHRHVMSQKPLHEPTHIQLQLLKFGPHHLTWRTLTHGGTRAGALMHSTYHKKPAYLNLSKHHKNRKPFNGEF